MEKVKEKRCYYLDVLRVCACLAVIMIHSSASYLSEDIDSLGFWIGNIMDSLSRFAVPIFVMISGALMLDEQKNFIKEKMVNRIKKMIIFFVFWSSIYCVFFEILKPQILDKEEVLLIEVIKKLITGHYHLWYIYMIIGLYLITPLLRLWIKEINKKYIEYFIGLSLLFVFFIPQVLRIGEYYCDFYKDIKTALNYLDLKYVGGFTTYFITGWYLHNFNINKKPIYILGVLALLITVFGTWALSYTTQSDIQLYDNMYINIYFQSIMVFVYIKNRFSIHHNKENRTISFIANCSLGIYAIHAAIVSLASKYLFSIGVHNVFICIPVVFSLSLGISILGCIIIKRIPIIKNMV